MVSSSPGSMSRRAKKSTCPLETRMKRFGMHEWLMKAVASPPTSASIDVRLSTSQMRILRLPSIRRSASARPIVSPKSSATLRPRRKCSVAKQPRPSIDDGRTSSRGESVAIKMGDAWHLPAPYDRQGRNRSRSPFDYHDGYVAATLVMGTSPGSSSASRRLAAGSALAAPLTSYGVFLTDSPSRCNARSA
jgi:hypothetical protein